MLNFRSILSDQPVAAVVPQDLKSVFGLFALSDDVTGSKTDIDEASGGVAISEEYIASACKFGSDALAVFLRVTLLRTLLQQEVLQTVNVGVSPSDAIIEAVATVPLPDGIRGLDLGQLVKMLNA